MAAITPQQLADQLAAMKAEINAKPALSPRMLDQYRLMIELERKCFDEERRGWEQERYRLTQYITCLEYSLTFYQAETLKKYTNPEKPYVRTGDEVWLGTGGQRSSQPVRSSEISPLDVSKPDGARGSVGESGPSNNSQAPFVMGTGISVPGKDQERDFDGILFKENIRAPPIAESFRAARLGSPFRFQPSTRETPPASSMPRSSLPGPSGILTTDPGRRASASQAVMTLVSSSLSTSLATPVQTDAEKLRREPYPSAAKLPSERAREHVPRQESDKDSGDAELKSPLGLKNDNVEDKGFLRALDSKLREAANAMKTDEPDKSKEHASKDDAGTRQPQPGPESEVEPALQLKPSLNFGTPFGAPYCGKGI